MKTILYFLLKIYINFLDLIIRISPKCFFPFYAWKIYYLIKIFARKEINRLKKNFTYVLEPSLNYKLEYKTFLNNSIKILSNTFLETLRIYNDPKIIQIDGYEEYKNLINKIQNKSIVFITGHLGSWELTAKYTAMATSFKGDFYVLAKPSKYPPITNYLDKCRRKIGAKVLWTNHKTINRQMLKILKNNGALGFVMDQKPFARRGVIVDFFNLKTEFVQGPAAMAIKTQSRVISIFCVRISSWHYKLIFKEIQMPDDNNIEKLTQLMAHQIESVIKSYPEQWCWNYKRWRDELFL